MVNRTVSGVAAVIGGVTMRGTKGADSIYGSELSQLRSVENL